VAVTEAVEPMTPVRPQVDVVPVTVDVAPDVVRTVDADVPTDVDAPAADVATAADVHAADVATAAAAAAEAAAEATGIGRVGGRNDCAEAERGNGSQRQHGAADLTEHSSLLEVFGCRCFGCFGPLVASPALFGSRFGEKFRV
jgi:hypothetical protein